MGQSDLLPANLRLCRTKGFSIPRGHMAVQLESPTSIGFSSRLLSRQTPCTTPAEETQVGARDLRNLPAPPAGRTTWTSV